MQQQESDEVDEFFQGLPELFDPTSPQQVARREAEQRRAKRSRSIDREFEEQFDRDTKHWRLVGLAARLCRMAGIKVRRSDLESRTSHQLRQIVEEAQQVLADRMPALTLEEAERLLASRER